MGREDAGTTRLAQREVGRRYIDTTRLDIKAQHGTVYLRGSVSKLRGHNVDLHHELELIKLILRGKPGIRDVIVDVTITD
jgi:hypothetical protein